MLITVSLGTGSLVSLDDMRTHLRVNISDDDGYIQGLIDVAQDLIQRETGIRFFADVYNEVLYSFPIPSPTRLKLTRYPVQSVDSIHYYDLQNTLQLWSSAFWDVVFPTNTQTYISPKFGYFYPITRPRPDAVQVQYTTGYNANGGSGNQTGDIPLPAIHACKLLVATWYENRENEGAVIGGANRELSYGIQRLLAQLENRGYY